MITKASPAKVNLYLRVLGKRADGYHEILSLMQRISLCDEMTFLPAADRMAVRCPDSSLPGDERNIVHRAATAFYTRIGRRPDVEITIRKRIPIAAGLGGGSSNAATTLMTLNEIAGSPPSREELAGIGANLGADIPFFIFENTAWVSGIGDRLIETAVLPPLWFVLMNPCFEVSTKAVYQGLNLGLTNERINYNIPRFYTGEDLTRSLVNDLEKVTLKLHPVLEQMKSLLLKSGAKGALMSGSGPTVFGVFTDEAHALEAERYLQKERQGWTIFGARSL
jgi:4-diphosphocytidyl-2-C-methyl-D-erythritol kinase